MKIVSKRTLLVLVIGLLALVSLYPLETIVVPEWKVRVVDEAGAPLRNSGIREVWQHYSIESKDHEQDLLTDGDGYVTFPKRTIRAPLLARIGKAAVNSLNPHGSSGPGAYVITLAAGYDMWKNDFYIPGQPLPKEVIVKKSSSQ
jgi:hypothetical protein